MINVCPVKLEARQGEKLCPIHPMCPMRPIQGKDPEASEAGKEGLSLRPQRRSKNNLTLNSVLTMPFKVTHKNP